MDDGWHRVRAVAADGTSGAAEIARAAALGLRDLAAAVPGDVRAALETLLRGHPAMAPLWRLATEVLADPDGDPSGAAERFLTRLQADEGVPFVLASVLPGTVVTISWSSTVLSAIQLRRPGTVACMRSDPGGEGVRAAEAMRGWTEATVVQDDDALERIPGGAVVVGADAVTPSGLVNKVKTRALAEAARAQGVPCFAAAGATKFVSRLPSPGPGFESTPLELFTGVAAPARMLTPAEAAEGARLASVHERLWPLLAELDRSTS